MQIFGCAFLFPVEFKSNCIWKFIFLKIFRKGTRFSCCMEFLISSIFYRVALKYFPCLDHLCLLRVKEQGADRVG